MTKLPPIEERRMNLIPRFIFASRWLQLPLYVGLIVAQVVYVFLFWEELTHLIQVLWKPEALPQIIEAMGIETKSVLADGTEVVLKKSKETIIMLIVLGLIDVVMISNLLIMVIVGGYETFVSKMRLDGHPDQPEWLSHVNANVLKVKLATAIIGISSIHLLKTFIDAKNLDQKTLMWQTIIHMCFIASAIGIALIDKLMHHAAPPKSVQSSDQPELH
jgi:uncharacterized protein (TIGR00645 family)